ncbi:hypothetical protein [Winogradskyella alexanderae]|uniref:DUF4138 domain-containing protein n=1 Tax=Winogradskyella alexanderae TaxID=2877123 RepID=A0ABS7XTD3_9FLAO|nr:hypothetical protein [Winogradskyella alexanderae]MCA0133294.1 hypothetical protein [Winogradskyella alexanderae]
MKTTWLTLVFLALTVSTYGQKSTLIQNVNYRAQELHHTLNESGDSLKLAANRKIHSVTIFNSNFERQFSVNKNAISIPLQEIPVGRYTTEVKLNGKLIIITLLRDQPILTKRSYASSNVNQSESFESSEGLNRAAGKTLDKPTNKNIVSYWIVSKIQNGNSSRLIRRAGDINVVKELIEQNKLDTQTRIGKFNELTVWEIYDKSEFMKLKRINPDYASVTHSSSFNVNPYYKTARDLNYNP